MSPIATVYTIHIYNIHINATHNNIYLIHICIMHVIIISKYNRLSVLQNGESGTSQ